MLRGSRFSLQGLPWLKQARRAYVASKWMRSETRKYIGRSSVVVSSGLALLGLYSADVMDCRRRVAACSEKKALEVVRITSTEPPTSRTITPSSVADIVSLAGGYDVVRQQMSDLCRVLMLPGRLSSGKFMTTRQRMSWSLGSSRSASRG
eukprot:752402-Hanusia_phi.AAC.5